MFDERAALCTQAALNDAFAESRSTFALRVPAGTQKDAAPAPVRRTSRRAGGFGDAEAGAGRAAETEMETGTKTVMETEAQAGGAEASPPGSPVLAVPAVSAGDLRADARTRDGAESGSGEQRQPPASSVDDGDGDGGLDNEAEEAAKGAAVEAGDAARNSSSVRDGAGSGDERDPGSARAVTCDDATRAAPAVPEKRASPTADANADADLDADLDADVDVDADSDAIEDEESAATELADADAADRWETHRWSQRGSRCTGAYRDARRGPGEARNGVERVEWADGRGF